MFRLFLVSAYNKLTDKTEGAYILSFNKKTAMHDVANFRSDNYKILDAKLVD